MTCILALIACFVTGFLVGKEYGYATHDSDILTVSSKLKIELRNRLIELEKANGSTS
ncbi:MAG: hypothetical protein U0930_04815 [Pirellulales bacterium]